jgi:hypothetical protein
MAGKLLLRREGEIERVALYPTQTAAQGGPIIETAISISFMLLFYLFHFFLRVPKYLLQLPK